MSTDKFSYAVNKSYDEQLQCGLTINYGKTTIEIFEDAWLQCYIPQINKLIDGCNNTTLEIRAYYGGESPTEILFKISAGNFIVKLNGMYFTHTLEIPYCENSMEISNMLNSMLVSCQNSRL